MVNPSKSKKTTTAKKVAKAESTPKSTKTVTKKIAEVKLMNKPRNPDQKTEVKSKAKRPKISLDNLDTGVFAVGQHVAKVILTPYASTVAFGYKIKSVKNGIAKVVNEDDDYMQSFDASTGVDKENILQGVRVKILNIDEAAYWVSRGDLTLDGEEVPKEANQERFSAIEAKRKASSVERAAAAAKRNIIDPQCPQCGRRDCEAEQGSHYCDNCRISFTIRNGRAVRS